MPNLLDSSTGKVEEMAPLGLRVKGGKQRERDNRLRALRATRPHTGGYIGGCGQEEGVIEREARSTTFRSLPHSVRRTWGAVSYERGTPVGLRRTLAFRSLPHSVHRTCVEVWKLRFGVQGAGRRVQV